MEAKARDSFKSRRANNHIEHWKCIPLVIFIQNTGSADHSEVNSYIFTCISFYSFSTILLVIHISFAKSLISLFDFPRGAMAQDGTSSCVYARYLLCFCPLRGNLPAFTSLCSRGKICCCGSRTQAYVTRVSISVNTGKLLLLNSPSFWCSLIWHKRHMVTHSVDAYSAKIYCISA